MSRDYADCKQPFFMYSIDADRYHQAARMIEDDLNEAYQTCRSRFGSDMAGVLLVAKLREKFNEEPPEYLQEKVNEELRKMGLLH